MEVRAGEPHLIVVDTGTWADYFNGCDRPWVARLAQALEHEEDIAVLPVIITEVLQGFRTESGFARARRVLVALPSIQLTVDGHVRAARLFRRLRKKGVTVRGAVDCIIAQTCIEAGAELLTPDRDFERMAVHTALRLCRS